MATKIKDTPVLKGEAERHFLKTIIENERKKVVVCDLIGCCCCASSSDGQAVYDFIHPLLAAGHRVEVNFDSATIVTSYFLNAAVGQLLHDISLDTLRNLLVFTGTTPDILLTIKIVIDNAKEYYRKHYGN